MLMWMFAFTNKTKRKSKQKQSLCWTSFSQPQATDLHLETTEAVCRDTHRTRAEVAL